MPRLKSEDSTIICPFYDRQNEHLLICTDDNVKEYSLIYHFTTVTACVRHKDRFCRENYRACPFYKELAKRYN